MYRNLGLAAAVATLLASAPLSAIFQRWTWLLQSALVVAVIAAAAALIRLVRVPAWASVAGMVSALLLGLTWMFPSGGELLGLVPAPQTFQHFGYLLTESVTDIRAYGVEVPDTDPLLFITTLGIGAVAILVDLLVVELRRPALAGLPMLAIYSIPAAIYIESISPVPFMVGASGFLWLLMVENIDRVRRFGRRFTAEGRDMDIWEPSPLATSGRRLAVLGVALAVLLPFAVPGMTGGMVDRIHALGQDGNGGTGQGGSPGRIDLFAALSGQLNQSDITELLTVATTEAQPFYLRFGVADELAPDGFRVRAPNGQPINQELPDPARRLPQGAVGRRYTASVEVSKNLTMPLLPVYAEPVKIQGLGNRWLYNPDLQIIFSKRDSSKGERYSFEYVRASYTPQLLRSLPPLTADNPLRQQQTITPRVPQVDQLVARLVQGKRTEYDKVLAIYDHFAVKNGFSYQLSTESGSSGAEIVDFLTNKVGFCQQYATAMAWLVRAAGIPARVAFGFTNGSNQRDKTYTLTNRNLHAWTEVFFSEVGWVPFDATPAAAIPGSTRTAWAPDTDAPEVEPSTPAGSTSANPTAGPDARDANDRDTDLGFDAEAGSDEEHRSTWPWWVSAALSLFGLLAVPGSLRHIRRRRRSPASRAATSRAAVTGQMVVLADSERSRAYAHAAWDELLDTLLDFRVSVNVTETPRTTAERLVRENMPNTESADAIRLLGRAEERARYARDPAVAGDLAHALRLVRAALRQAANRRTRFMAIVAPPSVLIRWHARAIETGYQMLLVSTRVRDGLGRWSLRRALAGRATR